MNTAPYEKKTLIVVDDDSEIRELLASFLSESGYRVKTAENGTALFRQLDEGLQPDCILMDIMMPGDDGTVLTRRLRAEEDLGKRAYYPIIMLTARSSDIDKILGLEIGADDYVTKPFVPRELLARVRALLRRSARSVPGKSLWLDPENASVEEGFTFRGWTLDCRRCRLFDPNRNELDLTAGEFDLLLAFASAAGRVLSRDQILRLTHGPLAEAYERSVDVLVSRLRKKLEAREEAPALIRTVRQSGYLFDARVEKIGNQGA